MALLSYENNFTAEDIVSVRELSRGQPVWLLTGLWDSTLVIKAEPKGDKGSSSLDQVAQIMAIVSPGMKKIKVLASSELTELKKWINFMQLTDDGFDEDRTMLLLAIQRSLGNQQRTFMKMETLRLMTLEDGNDRASKRIGKVLNGRNGLEDMGKIIAADMFNCNNDRFNFSTPTNLESGIKWGPKQKKLRYLVNPGNFMIREDGNEATLVGMDTYCNSDVIELSKEVPNTWIYSIFHPNRRKESVNIIAEHCAYDLKKVIGKTTGVISRYRLDKRAEERLAAGMIEGADAIEQYFRLKFGRQGAVVPGGLPSRANLAGWNWLGGVQTTSQAFGNLQRSRRN